MKFSIRQTAISALTVVLLLAFSAPLVSAKKDRQKDATRHASDAAKVFTEIMNVRDKAIPKELLDKAEAAETAKLLKQRSDEMKRGGGIPFEKWDAQMRGKHNIARGA